MTLISRISNYFHTIAHLRPVQLRHQLARRLLPAPKPRLDPGFGEVRAGLQAFEGLAPIQPAAGDDSIEFLNVARPFSRPDFDWRASGMSKLWRYNLHYFDYLHWDAWNDDRKRWLVEDWISRNPPGTLDAWEAYPVSLRTVNWIKFCLSRSPENWPRGILPSLAEQLLWLEVNLEYHVLANHFLKNGKALLFGGIFFRGETAERLLQKGLEIMLGEATEQFLADGGHYERSPQYHCICLEDYLDAIAFLEVNPGLCTSGQLEELQDTARRALSCLALLVSGDGRIPLFNDCAFGIAPEPLDLLNHGAGLVDEVPDAVTTDPVRVELPRTGYFGYRKGGDSFLLDCGAVGPDYQPGHAHCDTLSYELCIDGRRVIVDAGVYEYAGGEMRNYVRSTSAHNTVSVDDQDQSEMWGEFRVARRAEPVRAELSEWNGSRLTFRGAHDGFRRLPGRVIHEREVRLDTEGLWEVEDLVTGRGNHKVQSFIHLHPSITLENRGERAIDLIQHGRVTARIEVQDGSSVGQATGWYCPEFGRREKSPVLVLSATGPLPLRIAYQISKAPVLDT